MQNQLQFPVGGGLLGEKVRTHDWSSTPLGPMEGWPPALQFSVQQILESSFPACLVWGPELTTIYNDAYAPMLGRKPFSLGRPLSETWAEEWPAIKDIVDRAFAGEATFIEDFPLQTDRNGDVETAWFTFCYSPVRDHTGQVRGMIDTVVESTGKIVAERQLRELASSLELEIAKRTADRNRLWELSSDIMLIARFTGEITAVNPAWTIVLGWRADEAVGKNLLDFIHPDDLENTRGATVELAQGKHIPRHDNRYRHKDGSYRWLTWTASPGDDLINAVGRDFTAERQQAEALRRAEELLRQSQKMEAVGQLTGGIAHDFNNLLGAIGASLDVLEVRLSKGRYDGAERYIAMGQESIRRAASLTQRLLAFSRRQTLDPKPVDVNRLVGGLEDLIRRTVGPDVLLEVVGAGGLWPTKVDASQLENSLLNLCINARDAMLPNGGRLTVETANKWLDERAAADRDLPPGQYISLCVTDTGTGMTPDVIARAFDPFFTTKPLGQGTGLGLSMVYGFVRQTGGQVRIYSEVGQGTTMCLYLPRYTGEVADAEGWPGSDAEPAADDETVLVIEDETTIRLLIAEVLEDAGYRVITASDGPSGLKVLETDRHIDLVITDVGLPGGVNGRQVADAARVTRPALKVLFITGYAENAAVGNGHLAAGMAVLTKPFEIKVLASKVREIIESR